MSILTGRAVGIDVSKYQTPAEWSTINLHFVFARATIGTLNDWLYDSHITKARDASLITGAYHFSYDGVSVASQVKAFLTKAGAVDFFFLDVEGANGFSHAQTREFVDRVQQTGRKVGLYMSRNTFFDAGQDYDWVAQWTTTAPNIHWDFWQYGSYNGLDGDVYHGSPTQLRALIADTGGGVIPVPDPTPTPAGGDVPAITSTSTYRFGSDHVIVVPAGTDYFDGPGGAKVGDIAGTVPVALDFMGNWGGFRAVALNDPHGIYAVGWDAGTIRPKTAAELEVQAREFADCPPPPPPTDCSAIQAELDLANARALATAEVLRNQATLLGG